MVNRTIFILMNVMHVVDVMNMKHAITVTNMDANTFACNGWLQMFMIINDNQSP